MDAISTINSSLDVHKLLEYFSFDSVRNDGKYIRCACKVHGGDNPSGFVIDTTTGLWFCHTGGCGGGDAFNLVEKLLHIRFREAFVWLANFVGLDADTLKFEERDSKQMKELQDFIRIMKRKKTVVQQQAFSISDEIKNVSKFRSFKIETLRHFQLGHVASAKLTKRDGGAYTIQNRLAIPIFQDNIQVGISFRAVKKDDVPKWFHQPVNIETKNLLYNLDMVRYKSEIIVCEGIFDVWAFYEIGLDAVCCFGAHLSDMQYKLLLRTGADIVLAYDGDDAGVNATKKTLGLLQSKCNLSIIKFDVNEDPESITRSDLLERYKNRRKV